MKKERKTAVEGWITEYRARQVLGVSKATLRKYRLAGKLVPMSSRRPYRYVLSELREFARTWLPIIRRNSRLAGWGVSRRKKGLSSSQAILNLRRRIGI